MDLYVVEPQTLFISYLSDVLARAGMNVVRIATAFDLPDVESSQPAAVFVDIDFLDGDPVTVVETLRGALPAAVLIAYVGDEARVTSDALEAAGTNAVLSKHSTANEVVKGIKLAVESGRFVDPRVIDAESKTSEDEVRYVDLRTRPASETKS